MPEALIAMVMVAFERLKAVGFMIKPKGSDH